MPVNSCSDSGKPGYKWGEAGKCYIYNPESDASKMSARKKALAQGIAIGDIDIKMLKEELDKLNEVSTTNMPSGIKNPQQGYPGKKPRFRNEDEFLDYLMKSLTEWFREDWVDLSRPKPGGGFEPCGRADASTGKYPKCVPAARAARMTPEQIASAVRRKRRAESTERRQDKKPIYVSTVAKANVPTNPSLYARVKAEAKRLFDVYPSAYANAWLVREYKKRGGKYKVVNKLNDINKVAEDLTEDEAALADALINVAERFGTFDEEGSGIWVGYESAEENEDKDIGVHCSHCVLYEGNGVCKILSMKVEELGKCRFAIIPDGVVMPEMDDDEEDDMSESDMSDDDMSEDDMVEYENLISMLRQILGIKGE